MIIFESIRWRNLLSTGNTFTTMGLCKHANTLIVGENGAGKSSLLDALTFALFGKPYRNINKPQLVNSINGKELLVELVFKIGSNKYLIRRGIKPNVFELYVNGEMLNQDANSKDYQETLERTILKMNYKSFTQIVILGSASFTPFMQLSAADRRAVIEDLLGIKIFSSMNVLVKEKLSSLKDELAELRIRFESTQEKIEMHKTHIEEMRRNNQEIIDRKNKEIRENELAIEHLHTENEQLNERVSELMDSIADYDSYLNKQRKLLSYEAKIDTNRSKVLKEIQFYCENDSCPTCKQEIDELYKCAAIHSGNTKVSEYDNGLEKLRGEQNEIAKRISEIQSIQTQISECQGFLNRNMVSMHQIGKYNTGLRKEIEEFATKKVLSAGTREQSERLVSDLSDIVERRKAALEEKQYYEVAVQLLKDGGIKTRIIKQYLPIINKLVNKYLASMDFFVNFHIDQEFKEVIKSRHRDNFSYESFSEGEKQKIDLALLLTWRSVAGFKNSVNTNLLILDETFDSSLDAKGTDFLLEILHALTENTNIFVISHKDQLHDKFSHSIRFEKLKNFSQIVE